MSPARAVRMTITLTLLTWATLAPASRTASSMAPEPTAKPALSRPQIDLRGNHVRKAVVSYRLDPLEDLYEEHSPNTEIRHLSDPRS
jgi:hypothetical protein